MQSTLNPRHIFNKVNIQFIVKYKLFKHNFRSVLFSYPKVLSTEFVVCLNTVKTANSDHQDNYQKQAHEQS